ncbi:Protein lev-9 [Halotydeus destructor]|nr:Protein lev-9 [Halotydeus destructor]
MSDAEISSANSDDDISNEDDDSLCPRSREDASARGRQCLRKCKTDADCISSRKRCLCDGLCGWSCVRPVANGNFKVSGDYFGARVIYACDEGFYMSGPRERICQGDGTWSDQPPECKKEAMCGSPLAVPHARHTAPPEQSDFAIDSMVQYDCFVGYESKGFAKAKCLFYNGTAQWFGPDLKCIPRSCGHPGDIENGQKEGIVFTFTSKVTYECDAGFEMVGRPNRYCQSNGQWSGSLASCKPVQCSLPEEPANGRAVYSSVSYNSIVRYECRYGFKLVGPQTRSCGPLKTWQGADPKCSEIDCGSPGNLDNGYLEGRRTTLGSVIHFRCFEAMVFKGVSNSTTCLDTGLWSAPLPGCMAPCTVPEVDQGRIVGVAPGLPERPKNGLVIAPKTDHGMKAMYRCRDGYTLVGANVTTCNFGKWLEPTPTCQEIYCPFPGFLENGRVMLVGHMGMYDYRPYVRKVTNNKQIMYECDKGYHVVGNPGGTCVDGQWSPREFPKCVRGSHPNLKWLRRRRSVNSSEADDSKACAQSANCSQSLFTGEQLSTSGQHVAVKSLTKMAAMAATVTPVPRSGRSSRSPNNFKYAAKMKGTKNKDLKHEAKRQEAETAAKATPKRALFWRKIILRPGRRHPRAKAPCKAMNRTWMDVQVVKLGPGNDSYPHGTIVRLSCSIGYTLNLGSNKTARCVRGFWKPKEPECIVSPCKVPSTANGIYYLHHMKLKPLVDVINHGEAIHLQCLSGFQPHGSHSMKCWFGNWTFQETPGCLPGPCVLPEIQNGDYTSGYRSGLTISHGSSVQYGCKSGFVLGTQVPSRCIESRLLPEPPHCIAKHLIESPRVDMADNGNGTSIDQIGADEESESDVDEDEDDDDNGSLENSKGFDEREEENMMKKLLQTDQEMEDVLEAKLRASVKWCDNPDRIEHILKYPYGNSNDIAGLAGLPLISVAELNPVLEETTTAPSSIAFTDQVVTDLLSGTTGTPASDVTPPDTHSPFNDNETNANQPNRSGVHPPGTEILFRCIPIPGPGPFFHRYISKTSWKLTCEQDGWIGRPLPCDEDEDIDLEQLAVRTCLYIPESSKGENVLAFQGDRLLTDYEEFAPGTDLRFRCADIGKFAMTGPMSRKCSYGDWDGLRPSCFGLSQAHDYAPEKPPTILFRHELGPIAQSNDGKLIVYPGIILHLECLWLRKFGDPVWQVTHSSKDYVQGWTKEPERDSSLEYRLSIYHTAQDDSGLFTCVTPLKHRHSVEIVVKAVHCPSLPEADGLSRSDTSGTKMNSKVTFKCKDGMRLNGSPEVVCLPSGSWSSPMPSCQFTECPETGNSTDMSTLHA